MKQFYWWPIDLSFSFYLTSWNRVSNWCTWVFSSL